MLYHYLMWRETVSWANCIILFYFIYLNVFGCSFGGIALNLRWDCFCHPLCLFCALSAAAGMTDLFSCLEC